MSVVTRRKRRNWETGAREELHQRLPRVDCMLLTSFRAVLLISGVSAALLLCLSPHQTQAATRVRGQSESWLLSSECEPETVDELIQSEYDNKYEDDDPSYNRFNGRKRKSRLVERGSLLPKDCGRVSMNPDKDVVGQENPSNRVHRIAGGYTAREGEFPPYVQLEIPLKYIYTNTSCGGTLISDRHVITAAHCFMRPYKFIEVIPTMFHDALPDDQRSVAAKVCRSSKFDPDSKEPRWDVAILKLKQPFELNDKVQPACLPKWPIGDDQQAHIVGLGLVSDSPETLPTNLQALPVKRERCRHGATKTVICFETNTEKHKGDSCRGDSGGPILSMVESRLTVFGGVSYGPIDCKPGLKGFTVAADFYDMRKDILDLIKECA